MPEVSAVLTLLEGTTASPTHGTKEEALVNNENTVRKIPNRVILKQGRSVLGRGKDADVVMSIRVNKNSYLLSLSQKTHFCVSAESL